LAAPARAGAAATANVATAQASGATSPLDMKRK
jgi:hypothetical protein